MTVFNIDQLVGDIYEEMLASNNDRLPNLQEIEDAVFSAIPDTVLTDLKRRIARDATRRADKRLVQRGQSAQGSLLTGECDALEGVWTLPEGGRVRVRSARRNEYAMHLMIQRKNVLAVNQAFAADEQAFIELEPYFITPETTVEQARASWLQDNPPTP